MFRDIGDACARLMKRIRESEVGATAVEYGLMVALIAAVIIGAVVLLGSNTQEALQCTAESIEEGDDEC